MIVYPDEDYETWISEYDADQYFEYRLNSSEWDAAEREAALVTAYRTLRELSLNIAFDNGIISTGAYTDAEGALILKDLQEAQAEQALHEIQNDLSTPQAVSLSLSGLAIKMPDEKPQRYSPHALSLLRPYLQAPTIRRVR
jgi:hypothetical protein